MAKNMIAKFVRLIVIMVCFSLLTALVLIIASPDASKQAVVAGSVVVALIVGARDFGLFSEDFELV